MARKPRSDAGKPRGPRKKAGVETLAKPPGPGHNGGPPDGITDAERSALFLNQLPKLEALLTKSASINSEIRNLRKKMREHGFEKFEVDYALALRKRDEDDVVDQRRREARIARWLNHPVGTQADMFTEGTPKAGSDPSEQGRIAGSEGAVCKPPAHLNQADSQRWITGWQIGQAALAGSGIKAPTAQPDF